MNAQVAELYLWLAGDRLGLALCDSTLQGSLDHWQKCGDLEGC